MRSADHWCWRCRVLRELGYDPVVWHLNEGHTAFVVLERIRGEADLGKALKQHWSEFVVLPSSQPTRLFRASHDAFPFEIVEANLAGLSGPFNGHQADFLELGRYDNGSGVLFNMTTLALRTTGGINAVSSAHRR